MSIISMQRQVKYTKLHIFFKTDAGHFVFVFHKKCVKFQSTNNIQAYLIGISGLKNRGPNVDTCKTRLMKCCFPTGFVVVDFADFSN